MLGGRVADAMTWSIVYAVYAYAVFVNINVPLYVIGRTICLCI